MGAESEGANGRSSRGALMGHAAAREATYLYQTGELVPGVTLLGCGHATNCSRCGSLHPARFDDLRGSAAASCCSAHLPSGRATFLSARAAFLSARIV